jgi:hypothetical protein
MSSASAARQPPGGTREPRPSLLSAHPLDWPVGVDSTAERIAKALANRAALVTAEPARLAALRILGQTSSRAIGRFRMNRSPFLSLCICANGLHHWALVGFALIDQSFPAE